MGGMLKAGWLGKGSRIDDGCIALFEAAPVTLRATCMQETYLA